MLECASADTAVTLVTNNQLTPAERRSDMTQDVYPIGFK